jgi:cation transport ATPase
MPDPVSHPPARAPTGAPSGNAPGYRVWWERRHTAIAIITLVCIAAYLLLRYGLDWPEDSSRPILWVALAIGGTPLVVELTIRLFQRQFGSDLLAGISIVTAVLLGEYLAGTLVVLMLSGGEALESFAVRRASSVLDALARRMPSIAHRKSSSGLVEIPLQDIAVGDVLVVLRVRPVDGVVAEGTAAWTKRT